MKIRMSKNLEPLRASALARLDETMNARIQDVVASPLAILRARKLDEARAVLDGYPPGTLLTAEIFDQTTDVASLAAAVVAKAAKEAGMVASLEAKRQAAQAAVRSALNPAAIDAALEEFLNG